MRLGRSHHEVAVAQDAHLQVFLFFISIWPTAFSQKDPDAGPIVADEAGVGKESTFERKGRSFGGEAAQSYLEHG